MLTPDDQFQSVQKHNSMNKSVVDYQPLAPILSPIHRLHYSLLKIEATSDEREDRFPPSVGENVERETKIMTSNALTTKFSSVSPLRLPFHESGQISGLLKKSVHNRRNSDEKEMNTQYLSSSAPYGYVHQGSFIG